MPHYLKHPEHGVHIAYTPEEVDACRLNGWTPIEEEKPVPAPVSTEEPIKRRGRPPKVEK